MFSRESRRLVRSEPSFTRPIDTRALSLSLALLYPPPPRTHSSLYSSFAHQSTSPVTQRLGDGRRGLKDVLARDRAVLVELVDDRDAGRKLNVEDLLRGELLEVLDDGAERVAVSGDDDLLAALDAGEDVGLVVRDRALGRKLERLAAGRGDVVGAAPDVDLLLAELLAGCERG